MDINKDHTIHEIAKQVESKLGLKPNFLTQMIDDYEKKKKYKITITSEHKELLDKINKLLENDKEINEFNIEDLDENVINNFNSLKQNLGKLQILILMKKLEKSNTTSDVLLSFIQVLNQKIENVNEILVDQQGGGYSNADLNYKKLYIKYKYKYCLLKFNK
jgi:hypothetical protein